MANPRLYLLRSDEGTGGWSLHPPECRLMSDQEFIDKALTLASGTAKMVNGDWSRPSSVDYCKANAMMAKLTKGGY